MKRMSADLDWLVAEANAERVGGIPQWCEECNVGMVSSHVWAATPLAERKEMLAEGWRMHGKGGLCNACRHRAARAK